MRFALIDRILELDVGAKIVATKNLSLAEEYLADHFPGFPVMPGVLMLEAMTQAGAWLVRASEEFRHSIVILKEARQVRYGSFVEPGQCLTVTAEITGQDERETKLKATGTKIASNGDEQSTVSARLTLTRYNLADENASQAELDAMIVQNLRQQFAQLYRAPTPLASR